MVSHTLFLVGKQPLTQPCTLPETQNHMKQVARPRFSVPPVFDCFQYVNREGESLEILSCVMMSCNVR